MKLLRCIEIGKSCDLKTLAECYRNIEIHFRSACSSDEEFHKEMDELHKEANECDYLNNTDIDFVIEDMYLEWYYKTEEDKKYGYMSLREIDEDNS